MGGGKKITSVDINWGRRKRKDYPARGKKRFPRNEKVSGTRAILARGGRTSATTVKRPWPNNVEKSRPIESSQKRSRFTRKGSPRKRREEPLERCLQGQKDISPEPAQGGP